MSAVDSMSSETDLYNDGPGTAKPEGNNQGKKTAEESACKFTFDPS